MGRGCLAQARPGGSRPSFPRRSEETSWRHRTPAPTAGLFLGKQELEMQPPLEGNRAIVRPGEAMKRSHFLTMPHNASQAFHPRLWTRRDGAFQFQRKLV